MRTKASTTIPAQTEPKSVFDMTPFELSEIDQYQTANRGFFDHEETESLDWNLED